MRGAIDPWTLGFFISFLDGLTGYIVHPPGEQNMIESDIEHNQNSLKETKKTEKKRVRGLCPLTQFAEFT